MLAIALGLCSSLCWGVADFIGGTQSRRISFLVVGLAGQAVGLVALLVVAAAAGAGVPSLGRLVPAAVGGLAGIVGLAAFYRALATGMMSIVAPIAATGVAVPVVVGLSGGDRPAALQLVGIAAAVVGVVLASREADPAEHPGAPNGAPARRRGGATSGLSARLPVLLALCAALGFGAFFVGLRSSARTSVLWALISARAVSVVALALPVAIVAGSAGVRAATRERGTVARLTIMGLLDVTANGLYALATRHGLLSVVAVSSSLYPLGTVILARVVLGERVRRVQELGIAAAVAGVVLIAAG